ncbi:phospholipase [Amycolatopsis balhimycina DSM 5908]|uniref:Phospholipase n=1 Tax=Amycolatopsis balhimycina DSM 5908 TaxID=1081091 RepID=A0A428W352_AMYBA|nr:dienelactone hydrolase family protein [Amycolatopsis balhimycina]RSM37510.1 phospholipase [Amycolatopsis balhimycina DSM 5908]
MNPHLGQRVLTWGPAEASVVVLAVHGRGQEPGFMRELTERLGPLPARFVAPAAGGGSWYPLPFLQPMEANQPHLDHALAAIEAHIDTLLDAGTAAGDLVLLGFSQGACLLAHLLLTRPRPLGAAVLFTGGFIGPDPIKPPTGTELDGVPVLLRSIEDDPWVPAHRVAETGRLFEAAGARVDLAIEPGNEHVVTDEACAAAARVIGRLGS